MNLKNRKIISALVASLMVIILVGAAYALGTGQLSFSGVVNARTELRVNIVREVESAGLPLVNITIAENGQSANIVIENGHFLAPGDFVFLTFELENIGTIPAIVGQPIVYYEDGDWSLVEINWFFTAPGEGGNLPLEVGQTGFVSARMTLLDFDAMYLDEVFTFRVDFPYNWNN